MPGSTATVTKSEMVRNYEEKIARQHAHYERMQTRVEEKRIQDQKNLDAFDREQRKRMDAAEKRRKEIMDAKLGICTSKKRSSDMFAKKPLNRQLSRSANDIRKYGYGSDSDSEYDGIQAYAKHSLYTYEERSSTVYKSASSLGYQEVKQSSYRMEKREEVVYKAGTTASGVARSATSKEATVSTRTSVETSSRHSLGSHSSAQNIAVSVNQAGMKPGTTSTTSVKTSHVYGKSKTEVEITIKQSS